MASFDAERYNAAHPSSRSIVSALVKTQLFELFLQQLVPEKYRPPGSGAVNAGYTHGYGSPGIFSSDGSDDDST